MNAQGPSQHSNWTVSTSCLPLHPKPPLLGYGTGLQGIRSKLEGSGLSLALLRSSRHGSGTCCQRLAEPFQVLSLSSIGSRGGHGRAQSNGHQMLGMVSSAVQPLILNFYRPGGWHSSRNFLGNPKSKSPICSSVKPWPRQLHPKHKVQA